jgi:L-lactate dehydrogenase complex protein LldG
MSHARTAILDRVRRAGQTGFLPSPHPHGSDHARSAHATSAPTTHAPAGPATTVADLLTRFLAELTAVGVTHHVETSAEGVRARVQEIVDRRSVLAWTLDRLPYDVGSLLPGAATGASPRDVQAAAEIGVTGCDAAIAETGSLVMLSGEGRPRAASLLPPVHLCIVRQDDLLASMGELFAARAADVAAAACCTFITGPSRTADIELTLTLGVHGPGEVIVIVGPKG